MDYQTIPPPAVLSTVDRPGPPSAEANVAMVTDHGPPVINSSNDLAFTGSAPLDLLILLGTAGIVAGMVVLRMRRRLAW